MKRNQLFTTLIFTVLFVSACKKDDFSDIKTTKQLDNRIEEEMERQNLTSLAYCVVKDDIILHSQGIGLANVELNYPAHIGTRYLIASVSKTVTAVALMQLVDQNLIALDDDINAFLPYSVRNPAFPNTPITYRMLLSHHSSISDAFQNTLDLDCYGTDCGMTLTQFFDEVFLSSGQYNDPSNFSNAEPGTVEDYSNLGMALVGYLVERITQTPFDTYCEDHIFTPLSMPQTDWRLANSPETELAVPYSPDITHANPHYTFPDYPNGGLRTNVEDLSRFLRAVILYGSFDGIEMLSSPLMYEMKNRQFDSAEQGLGFYYLDLGGRTLLGHEGGEKGVSTAMFMDPSTNIGAIVLNNDDDAKLDDILSMLFAFGENQ